MDEYTAQLEIPLTPSNSNASTTTLFAHGSSKKAAERAVCLDACIQLDTHDLFFESTSQKPQHRPSKRQHDAFDGEDGLDAFYDRVSDERRVHEQAHPKVTVETYETLSVKFASLLKQKQMLESSLVMAATVHATEDPLDAFMDNLKESLEQERRQKCETELADVVVALERCEVLMKLALPSMPTHIVPAVANDSKNILDPPDRPTTNDLTASASPNPLKIALPAAPQMAAKKDKKVRFFGPASRGPVALATESDDDKLMASLGA